MMRPLFSTAFAAALLSFLSTADAAPTSVTVTGSLQSELGCASDFDPACANSGLVYDANDDVWQRNFMVPAGSYGYIATLDGSFAERYGRNAVFGGANIDLTLAATRDVRFYYDHKTHWITDNVNSVIAVLAGSFQSELGCSSDFDPSCLRSWLQDIDGDGIYTLVTDALPGGNYSTIVAINESFDETYGPNGVPGGGNIDFTVPETGTTMTFSYDSDTHILTITAEGPVIAVPEPTSLATLAGALLAIPLAVRRRNRRR